MQLHCKDCGKLYPAPVAIDGPGCQCREKPLTVLGVLDRCERDFAFIGGCTVTDRPDLPLSSDTSWQIDVSHLLESIRWAKQVLGGPALTQPATTEA